MFLLIGFSIALLPRMDNLYRFWASSSYTSMGVWLSVNGHREVANLLRAFGPDEMAWTGGRERERAVEDERDTFADTLSNDQNSMEVQMSDRTSQIYRCPLGEECTSRSSSASRHQDILRHVREKHPTSETTSSKCCEQQRLWYCCRCGDGPELCQCNCQTRCFDCGGPARSDEVEEGWIEVGHPNCPHKQCGDFHGNRYEV